MADVKFIVGLSRSGKTALVHDEIVAELRARPLGPAIYWIVPRQATFGIERWLACDSGLPGFSRVRVMAFDGLAREVEAQAGSEGVGRLIDPIGRRLLILLAYQRVRDRLTVLRADDRPVDWANSISRLLAEFSFQQSPTDEQPLHARLRQAAEDVLAQPSQSNQALAAKLADLAEIEQAYQQLLDQRECRDSTRRLNAAAKKVASVAGLAEARVYVDGFFTLSAFERAVLVEVARVAASTTVTILAPPESPVLDQVDRLADLDLFHQPLAMYRDVRLALRAARLGATVERCRPSGVGAAAAATEALARGEAGSLQGAGGVALIEAPDVTAECAAVAGVVAAAVRGGQGEKACRYRDVLVLVPSTAAYETPLRVAFAEAGIPVEVDAGDLEPQHRLGRVIRTLTSVAAEGWSLDDLCDCAVAGEWASAFVAARMRSWLLHHPRAVRDVESAVWQDPADPEVGGVLEPVRGALVDLMLPFRKAASAGECTFAEIATPFVSVLLKLYHPWTQASPLPHEPVLWQQWCESLDSLLTLSAGEVAPPRHWLAMLDQASSMLRVALPPRSIDHVTISTAQRTRLSGVVLCIMMGGSSGLEMASSTVPALSGEECQRLSASGVLGRQHAAFRGLLDQRLVSYHGLTRWRERLVATRPLRYGRQEGAAPSVWFEALKDAGAKVTRVGSAVVPSPPVVGVGQGVSVESVEAGLLAWAAGNQPKAHAGAWAAWYSAAVQEGGPLGQRLTSRAVAAAQFYAPAATDPPKAKSGQALVLGARQLESYLLCPFRYSAEHEHEWRAPAERGILADDWVELLRRAGYAVGQGAMREAIEKSTGLDPLAKSSVSRGELKASSALSGQPERDNHLRAVAVNSLRLALDSMAAWMTAAQAGPAEILGNGFRLELPGDLLTPGGNRLTLTTNTQWLEKMPAAAGGGTVLLEWTGAKPGKISFAKATVESAIREGILIAVVRGLSGGDGPGMVGHLRVGLRRKLAACGDRDGAEKAVPLVGHGAVSGWVSVAAGEWLVDRAAANALDLARKKDRSLSKKSMTLDEGVINMVADKCVALACELADRIAMPYRLVLPVWHESGLACKSCKFGDVCRFDIRAMKAREPSADPVVEAVAATDDGEGGDE